MSTRTSAILLIIIFNLSLHLCAQEKWTLNQCISYGIKNNLQLHNAELNEKLASQYYKQSKWNLLPNLNAGSSAAMNYGRSIDPNTNGIISTAFFNNSYSLNASVDLFRGFMLQMQIGYQKFRREAAENNRVNTMDDLAFEVMTAFYKVIYNEELLKIANEQKALSELNVKKTEILVSAGLKSQTELLEVRANYEKDELFCIQTSNNIQASWISLKKAMNLSPDLQITLVNPDEQTIRTENGERRTENGDQRPHNGEVLSGFLSPNSRMSGDIIADIPELYKLHSEWSPRIKTYENEWRASLKDVNIRRAGYYPSIRLQASYNTGFYETRRDSADRVIAFNQQINNNQNQFLGASLSIPVFNKNAARLDVRRSKIISEQAETKLEQTKQDLLFEMEQNYNDLTASWKELQQAERQLEADKLVFQAAQKKFDQGMINVVEFYTIKNRLANTTSQVLHSKLTLEIKKRTMDFYKGERFWEKKSESGERRQENGNRKWGLSGFPSPVSGFPSHSSLTLKLNHNGNGQGN